MIEKGLSQSEAEKRLLTYGPNTLRKSRVSAWKVFFRQLKSSLIYLLVAASLLSYWIGDGSDALIIFIILSINTSLAFFQEYKSEKSIEKLSSLITMQVRVYRDGDLVLLDQSKLVPGDVVVVHEGDIAPADIKLLQVDHLEVSEAQLTGESLPQIKQQNDLLLTGSVIEKGVGVGAVFATGEKTGFGKIAVLSRETKKETQYEKSLKEFSSFLIKTTLLGLFLIFICKLILDKNVHDIASLFLFIIATAIAVVPEVLPVITTVSLSSAALKLSKKHIVTKRLSSIEDLGNVNMLCTDKTGTITENKMSIKNIVSSDEALFQKLAYAAIIPIKHRKRRQQNSYDDAFFAFVSKSITDQAKSLVIVKELPFDPKARRRRVILEDRLTNKHYLVSLGAPEACAAISNHSAPRYLDEAKSAGKQGLHTLGIAYKEISYLPDFDIVNNEHDLFFLGYVSLEDPLRKEAKSTISHAKQLGIEIKILTGDSKEVAEYVGKKIDLVGDGKRVYLGDELEKLSKEDFKQAVLSSHIFARITPEQKYNIIKVLKESYVVAYQGDGINDAPALKIADVAIAVSQATDIAKESADIVLLHKSLSAIINGIKEGRAIFVNINKYIKYTMISNFGNFIALSVLYLFSTNLPLLPVQVLLMSVICDIPLILISSDTVEDVDVIRPEKHRVKELLFFSILLGIPTALFELFYFLLIRKLPQPALATHLYLFFTFIALVVFYAIRSKPHFWETKPPPKTINIAFFLAFATSLALIYLPNPQSWFSFSPLSWPSLFNLTALTVLYFFVVDLVKTKYYGINLTFCKSGKSRLN
jgi:P-type Mg2+ transporter